MMRVVITKSVRDIVASGLDQAHGNQRVLDDLRTWTLTPIRSGRRTESAVWMFGGRYRYTARLAGFHLPDEWCVCQVSRRSDCCCADSSDRPESLAIVLMGASPINTRDVQYISAGDSYGTAFTVTACSGDDWWYDAADRWRRTQVRVAHRPVQDAEDPLPRWNRIVKLRRAVVEELAQPLPYDEVDLEEETGLLLFTLAAPVQGRAARHHVPPDVIYEPAGHRRFRAKLRTIEIDEDGRLRCEVEAPGDPVEIAAFAARQRGPRRRLVRDQEATSTVLDREEHVMRDVLSGAAVNPRLLGLLRQPGEAAFDSWLSVPEVLLQPELDRSQREALDRALRARHMLVVQGPPGTGKTTFIAELVLQHLSEHPGDTVLVAAQTNQATDNLLRRVHLLDRDLPLVRIGRDERKIADDILPFWVHSTQPWQAGVRVRAERYRRFALAQSDLAGGDDELLDELLAIQDEYLGDEGVQRSEEQRIANARVVAGTCYGVSKSREVREARTRWRCWRKPARRCRPRR